MGGSQLRGVSIFGGADETNTTITKNDFACERLTVLSLRQMPPHSGRQTERLALCAALRTAACTATMNLETGIPL